MIVCSTSSIVLAQSMISRAFSRNEAVFASFCHKVHRNVKTWYFFSKSCRFWRNRWFLVLFHEMRHFLQLLSEKLMKMPRCRSLLQKLQVLAKSMVFRVFSRIEPLLEPFAERFIEKPKHGSLLEKMHSFGQIDEFSSFFTKSGSFWNFSLKSWSKRQNMVIRVRVRVKVAKSWKNCLTSWKSTKNHLFGKNYATFSNKLPWVRVRVRVRVFPNPNP